MDFKLINKDHKKGYFDALKGVQYKDALAYWVDEITCVNSFRAGFKSGTRC